MLLRAEVLRIALGETADDGECRQLRLGGKPALDQGQIPVELGGHSDTCLVTPLGSTMRRAWLNCFSGLRPKRSRKCLRVRLSWLHRGRRANPSTSLNAMTQLLLSGTNLSQQSYWIKRAVLRAQTLLDCLVQFWMLHGALIGRYRSMIALDDFRPLASLLLQLEGRLEEVHVEARRRIEPGQHFRGFHAVEAAVADEPAHDGTVLLLDESLIILSVWARASHLGVLFAAPAHNDIVHERAIVIEVDTAQKPWKQTLYTFNSLDDQGAVAGDQWHTFRPARCHVHHGQRLVESAGYRCASVRYHVDLAEPRGWVLPVVERMDRHFATDCRMEPGSPPATTSRHDLRLTEQSIDGRRAHGTQQRCLAVRKPQPAVPLQSFP